MTKLWSSDPLYMTLFGGFDTHKSIYSKYEHTQGLQIDVILNIHCFELFKKKFRFIISILQCLIRSYVGILYALSPPIFFSMDQFHFLKMINLFVCLYYVLFIKHIQPIVQRSF